MTNIALTLLTRYFYLNPSQSKYHSLQHSTQLLKGKGNKEEDKGGSAGMDNEGGSAGMDNE